MGSNKYGPDIDMWSIGCIFGEMVTGRALFPGVSVHDELLRIFKILGTPIETSSDGQFTDGQAAPDIDEFRVWPGVSQLPDWKPDFPEYSRIPLAPLLPKLNTTGIDLFQKLLAYPPSARISALHALERKFHNSCIPPPYLVFNV
ncbi:Cell division control protein 2-like protein [Smittium mucronatum]|uniref:Cell division control protein 2-like protein n=1 Tax=Smittium mucronatum TaxID=133383 RepID=A0A1R0GT94_9FUNG|nr:Cell division control protein 2-like protein [Smittium mucronatum]